MIFLKCRNKLFSHDTEPPKVEKLAGDLKTTLGNQKLIKKIDLLNPIRLMNIRISKITTKIISQSTVSPHNPIVRVIQTAKGMEIRSTKQILGRYPI